ncbi:MAG: thioredoxin domain-containing protein [Planctomycetota bacterium]|nr:thioredoxin domain-containing protein [Planctomycetota bacterium]
MASRILLLAALAASFCGTRAFAEAPPEAPRIRIAWRAWGPEAFAEAKRLDRPVFLWIYARWSASSAVMAEDTLADEKAAAMLNELFVPVRVDLDRRPDIDRRHQQAVQALGATAGWPLTAILTPDGHVGFGGTFFSLDDDYVAQRPGLRTILFRAAEGWRKHREAFVKDAGALEEELRKPGQKVEPAAPKPETLETIARNMVEALDPVGGGFGPGVEGPKYPTPQALELALANHARSGDPKLLEVVTRTLDGMLHGGIYDQIGGGFHRFARDRRWRLPRFEKLLAVDAEMLPVLIHAWQATGNETYAQAAQATLAWYETVMTDHAKGGFYASMAADEAYYTWTVKELEAAVRENRAAEIAAKVYEIEERGDLAETAPFRNVLFRAARVADASKELGVDLATGLQLLSKAQAAMLEARNLRPAPPVDKAILVDANARMASAYLLAAEAFGRADLRAFALKTLERLLKEALEPGAGGRGAAHVIEPNGTVGWYCFSSDEAALALACQDAYAATGEARWLEAARGMLARLDERFLDPEDGTYLDRAAKVKGAPEALGRLGDAYKPFQDTPMPSVNAMAALAQLRQTALTRDPAFAARARKTLGAYGPLLEMLGGLASSLPLVADASLRGTTVLVVEGGEAGAGVKDLRTEAARAYAPHKLVLWAETPEQLAALGLQPEGPRIHVLSGARPAVTVKDASKLKDALAAACRKE